MVTEICLGLVETAASNPGVDDLENEEVAVVAGRREVPSEARRTRYPTLRPSAIESISTVVLEYSRAGVVVFPMFFKSYCTDNEHYP